MSRTHIKPGKAPSVIGAVVGLLFVILGITIFIPLMGIFGAIWTGIALVITTYYIYNVFSEQGVSIYDIEFDPGPQNQATNENFDTKLRKLAKLKEDRLISEEEYQQKRAEVMQQQW